MIVAHCNMPTFEKPQYTFKFKCQTACYMYFNNSENSNKQNKIKSLRFTSTVLHVQSYVSSLRFTSTFSYVQSNVPSSSPCGWTVFHTHCRRRVCPQYGSACGFVGPRCCLRSCGTQGTPCQPGGAGLEQKETTGVNKGRQFVKIMGNNLYEQGQTISEKKKTTYMNKGRQLVKKRKQLIWTRADN